MNIQKLKLILLENNISLQDLSKVSQFSIRTLKTVLYNEDYKMKIKIESQLKIGLAKLNISLDEVYNNQNHTLERKQVIKGVIGCVVVAIVVLILFIVL